MMTPLAHTRRLLGDLQGIWSLSDARLQDALDRGARDLGRRGLLIQKSRTFVTAIGTTVYPLPADHMRTFTCFQGLYSTSLRLLSQDDHSWWLTVDTAGLAAFTDVQPAGAVLLGTSRLYWLEIRSPDDTPWYVHPANTGELLVEEEAPTIGPGTAQTVQLRDPDGFPWYPAVSDMRLFALSSAGTATLKAAQIDDEALQQVEPEAITRIDPRPTSGPPQRFALLGAGTILLHPTPDKVYQVRQLYFSDDVLRLPPGAESQPVLSAAAFVLQRRGASAAGVLAIYEAEVAMLRQTFTPDHRDGASLYSQPVR